jgi:hypothetical protein
MTLSTALMAVSYTWGPSYPTREISLEGQSFTVRENLWQFLDAARDYAKDWLWIDQVCIDQSNSDFGSVLGVF